MRNGDTDNKIGQEIEGPVSCCQRYDAWLWNTKGQTREEKSQNHVKAHEKVGEKYLFIYRALVVIICIINAPIFWHRWVTEDTGTHFPLVYLTYWAFYGTIVYFILVCVAHIRHQVFKK